MKQQFEYWALGFSVFRLLFWFSLSAKNSFALQSLSQRWNIVCQGGLFTNDCSVLSAERAANNTSWKFSAVSAVQPVVIESVAAKNRRARYLLCKCFLLSSVNTSNNNNNQYRTCAWGFGNSATLIHKSLDQLCMCGKHQTAGTHNICMYTL